MYRKTGHVTYYTRYHIVWIPRYRRKVLVKGLASFLKTKLLEVKKWYPDLDYIKMTILYKVYEKQSIWSTGYFVSTAGINEETIKNYLARQEKEDSGQVQLALDNTMAVRAW